MSNDRRNRRTYNTGGSTTSTRTTGGSTTSTRTTTPTITSNYSKYSSRNETKYTTTTNYTQTRDYGGRRGGTDSNKPLTERDHIRSLQDMTKEYQDYIRDNNRVVEGDKKIVTKFLER